MRRRLGWAWAGAGALLLAAAAVWASCALRDYVPRGPVTGLEGWQGAPPEPVRYTGPARVPFPVPPFQIFGVHYDDDIVVVTDHPHWTMHEYARIRVGDRWTWIAKDSDPDGVQTLTAPTEDLAAQVPEAPLPRRVAPVDVVDRSTETRLDVRIATTTPRGEAVTLSFAADRPEALEDDRNSSTFNHSERLAAVVLDVSKKEMDAEVTFTYDGAEAGIERVLFLVPVHALLAQTQGGLAVASMRLTATSEGYRLVRPVPGIEWPTRADEAWSVVEGRARYENGTNRFEYHYEDGGLVRATVWQAGREAPVFEVVLDGPLPDLSRPFEGEVRRRLRADVNGQVGHGVGHLVARGSGDSVVVDIVPEAPRWFAARPLRTTIVFAGGAAEVTTVRVLSGG